MDILVVLMSRGDSDRDFSPVESLLGDRVEVRYRDRIDGLEWEQILREADYFLSLSPGEELEPDEFNQLHEDQVLQMTSAGIDHVPFDRLPTDMPVLSNAGAYAEPIAEHVLAMYLALCKRLVTRDREMRDGKFNQFQNGLRVRGSTCGIFGFGSIGEATARLMKSLSIEVQAINRSGRTDEPVEFIGGPESLKEVMKSVDGLVISAPLTPETRGMIDRKKLEWMKEDAFLINVSRGEIVVQKDLYEHLREHSEFQAGIESWWVEPIRHGRFELNFPLLEFDNVLACPHNSSMVPGALERGLRRACMNLAQVIKNDEYNNLVDPQRGY